MDQASLAERLEKLDVRLQDIQAGIAEVRAVYADHHRRLDRIERTMYGDGAAGLCTKVSAILWVVSGVAAFVVLLAAQMIAGVFH